MNRDKMRLLTLFGLAFYLLSLLAPAMVAWVDIEMPEALEEMIVPEQKEGYDQLNEAQKKAMVDWSRNSSSQNFILESAGGAGAEQGNAITVDSNGDVYVTGSFYANVTFGSTVLSCGVNQNIFIAKLSKFGSWIWAVKACASSSTNHYGSGIGIGIDLSGNAFVSGNFQGTVTFGNISLASNGSRDIFMAKLSSNGIWQWVVKAGGDDYDSVTEIAVDSSGNAYVTGSFNGTASFGSTSLTSSGYSDIFIAKLTSNGIWQWAVKGGGGSNDVGYGIAVDLSGNAYVTGYFTENFAGVGTVSIGNINLTPSGYSDIFIAKLTNNGIWQWVVQAGGGYSYSSNSLGDRGKAITVDSNGDVYVTGAFRGTASFGNFSLISSGYDDIFIAKLSNTGTWNWASKKGSQSQNSGEAIVADSYGNIFITTSSGMLYNASSSNGSIQNEAGIGSGLTGIAVGLNDKIYSIGEFSDEFSLAGVSIISRGSDDIFVSGFSTSFGNRFAISSIIEIEESYSSFVMDGYGNAYFGGTFWGTASFGSILLSDVSGAGDIFIAKLASNGLWQWATKAGSGGSDYNPVLSIYSRNIYVTGKFQGTATFGNTNLTSAGDKDIFIAKLSDSGTWQWAVKAGGTEWDSGKAIDVSSSGIFLAGCFKSNSTFGSTNLSSSGGTDIFIAKLSDSGTWQWASRAGDSGNDCVNDIVVGLNHFWITGYFYGTVTFGNTELISSGSSDIFIGMIWTGGDIWLWAKKAGGTSSDGGEELTLDGDENIYVSGNYKETAIFGSTSLTSAGSYDIFVAKLSDSGSWQWVVRAGGNSSDYSGDILYSNGIIITGSFKNSANFGHYNITSKGGSDIFLAKINDIDGSWQSVIQTGSSTSDGASIAMSGDLYISMKLGSSTATIDNSRVSCNSSSTCYLLVSTGKDFDLDKVVDSSDAFPFEFSQHSDQDGDMFGDNFSGYHGDSCPSIYGTSWQDRWGCPDMDGDGQSDLFDAYMQIPTQWNDTDGDGRGDNWDGVNVDRNGSTNGIGEYWPNAFLPDPSPLDYDNDGFEDSNLQSAGATGPYDDCPFIYGTSTEDSSGCIDSDGDGWSDSADSHPGDGTQHSDQDNDGYGDNATGNQPDACPTVYGQSWMDVYGCVDADGDGVSSQTDYDDDDGDEWRDSDDDGHGDNVDECTYVWGNIVSGDDRGCPDADGDGWADRSDDLPHEPTQHVDTDGDSYGDNQSGLTPDSCISTSGTSIRAVSSAGANETKFGCPDTDSDGYADLSDPCPFQFGNSWVDRMACPDGDQDGISDANDPYPNNPSGTSSDWDGDGVNDGEDAFPADSTQWSDVDSDGHGDNLNGTEPDVFANDPTQWSDLDGDGFGDNVSIGATTPDACVNEFGESADAETGYGCPDTDGDGIGDIWDAFPFNQAQWSDSDGDGYGENMSGSEPDACPNDAGTSWLGGFGCPDADRDGWGDVNDAFPTDSSQWNDSDGDGYGDNAEGREPDTCPDSAGDSSEGDVFGCPDSDGDGWADIEDRFVDSNTTWSDSDNDGFADQGDDDCPNLAGSSTISMVGCPDLDGDGLPDILDPDIDGDGLFNTWEYQTDNDPFDANDYPDDTDGDGTPDKYDDDDDGDEFPDSVEKERGTDPKDPEDNPMNQYGDNTGIFFIPGEGFQSGYDAEGYELSVSALVNLLTSEFLLPLLLLPASLLLLLRKRGRFKKMRKRLKSVDSVDELGGAEEAIDRLIMKNRVKVVHGILLRNLYERRRDQLGEDGPKPTLQSRNEQMPQDQPTEWNSPPQRPDNLGNDQYMGGGGRY